jgi:ParB/RepB/Spo0J family partition protein
METITQIAIDQLHESPFNPRKVFNEASLQELATDIASQGRVLSPLLVRPRVPPLFAGDPDATNGYEIVFGHRRFRAAQLAHLVDVPCMVRSMTDEEVKKAQISENLQRDDVHPIEEAEGFQALIDGHNVTADMLAEQTGKSRSYVYGRLKLLDACAHIRNACLAGEIGAEVALLISRLRTDKLQEKALGYIRGKSYDLKDGGTRSFREVRDLLNERFTLQLKSAMFDIEDEMLLPMAGHCIRCPKRSGNAPEFADVVTGKNEQWHHRNYGADVCTDPDCFDAKKKAHLKREAEKLEAKGAVVIDGNKARAAIDASGNIKGAYIALKDVQADLKKAPKKSLAGYDLAAPEVVTIQDPRTGKTFKAVKREDVKAAGVKLTEPKKSSSGAYDWKAEQAKREAEHAREQTLAKAEGAVRLEWLKRVRDAAGQAARSTLDLQLVAHVAFAGVDYHDRGVLSSLYGGGNRDDLHKKIGTMDATDVALFALTCALVQDVATHTGNYKKVPTPLHAAAKHYGLDLAAIRKELEGGEPASTPSPAARAPKKAKAGAGAKKGKATRAALEGEEQGEEQKDDAGVAGGSDAEAGALEEAGA